MNHPTTTKGPIIISAEFTPDGETILISSDGWVKRYRAATTLDSLEEWAAES